MTRAELIAALERADGFDRELNAAIWAIAVQGYGVEWRGDKCWYLVPACYCGPDKTHGAPHWHTFGPGDGPPEYMRSIDSALRLVPEGWSWLVADTSKGPRAALTLRDSGQLTPACAATPALALCIAALRAQDAS